jgi:hypothetical protein
VIQVIIVAIFAEANLAKKNLDQMDAIKLDW